MLLRVGCGERGREIEQLRCNFFVASATSFVHGQSRLAAAFRSHRPGRGRPRARGQEINYFFAVKRPICSHGRIVIRYHFTAVNQMPFHVDSSLRRCRSRRSKQIRSRGRWIYREISLSTMLRLLHRTHIVARTKELRTRRDSSRRRCKLIRNDSPQNPETNPATIRRSIRPSLRSAVRSVRPAGIRRGIESRGISLTRRPAEFLRKGGLS